MAAALSLATRRGILAGYQAGQSRKALATTFGVNYRSVQTLIQRFEAEGEAGLLPRYARCGRRRLRSDRLFYRAALTLKRRHRRWGAPFILLQLEARYPERVAELPSVRTLQAWFKAAGLNAKRSQPPAPEARWAHEVHQVWQVDAKEHQRTADGQSACWLTVTDEKSTAVLAAPVFPLCPDQPGAACDGARGA